MRCEMFLHGLFVSLLMVDITRSWTTTKNTDCLVYSDLENIWKYCIDTKTNVKLHRQGNTSSIVPVDYDFVNACAYFAEIRPLEGNIWVVCNGEPKEKRILHTVNNVEGVAYDWITGNVYWLSRATKQLAVTTNDGRFTKVLYEGEEIFDKPRALALHAALGLLFWADWSDTNPRIVRASMNGDRSSLKTIVKGADKLGWPNGLALDLETPRLYWTDAEKDIIASVNLDGGLMEVYINRSGIGSHFFAITLSKNYIYWTDWTTRNIQGVRKSNPNEVFVVKQGLSKLMGLSTWQEKPSYVYLQANGDCTSQEWQCEHFCLPTYQPRLDRAIYDCYCEHGYSQLGRRSQCIKNSTLETISTTPLIESQRPNVTIHQCEEGTFQCDIGVCKPNSYLCDQEADCKDGTDEIGCEATTCGQDEFACQSGKCIPARWRCDWDEDCTDGSDERHCSGQPRCTTDEFLCNDTKPVCMSMDRRCDMRNDCKDGSDEIGCPVFSSTYSQITCPVNQFSCDGSKCVPQEWACDSDRDCIDESDEQGCTNQTCPPDRFNCGDRRCIPSRWICDGDSDCKGGKDEENCKDKKDCKESEFSCDQGCIPRAWVCDNEKDCKDSSDERNCSQTTRAATTISTPLTSTPVAIVVCGNGQFSCASKSCIPKTWVCDSEKDCPDGSDESDCSTRTSRITIETINVTVKPTNVNNTVFCGNGQFSCSGKSCIPKTWACDGEQDCPDGSDESDCPTTTAKTVNQTTGMTVKHENVSDTGGNVSVPATEITDCVIFTERERISRLCPPRRTTDVLIQATGSDLITVVLSSRDNCIIYSNKHKASEQITIEEMCLPRRNTSVQCSTIVRNITGSIQGLAFDWTRNNIYWMNSDEKRLSVADRKAGYNSVLYKDVFDSPRDIALHPHKGILFWTDWSKINPRIGRASMDGDAKSVEILISGRKNLGYPNGIVVDHEMNKIIWVDAKMDKIGTADLNGDNIRTLISLAHPNPFSHPFGVALSEHFIYWTDWRRSTILALARNSTSNDPIVLYNTTTIPFRLAIMSNKPTEPPVPCPLSCDHLCLAGFDPQSHESRTTCLCADGFAKISETRCVPVAKNVFIDTEVLPPTTKEPPRESKYVNTTGEPAFNTTSMSAQISIDTEVLPPTTKEPPREIKHVNTTGEPAYNTTSMSAQIRIGSTTKEVFPFKVLQVLGKKYVNLPAPCGRMDRLCPIECYIRMVDGSKSCLRCICLDK